MDERREKLISMLLGDEPVQPGMQQDAEYAQLRLVLAALKADPREDVSDAAVARLLLVAADLDTHSDTPISDPEGELVDEVVHDVADNLIRVNFSLRRALPRIAAVAVIALILGVAVAYTPRGSLAPEVARVDGTAVIDGDLIEARAGAPRTITFATGEVLLDGASAVRLYDTGRYSPPRIEVERGRMVLTARSHDVRVAVAGNDIQLAEGGMLAVSYDRAYASIKGDGSLVEVQRMPIEEVAALAGEVYGLQLDLGEVPENIRRQRVTFFGNDLGRAEFLDSFVQAAAGFGIRLAGEKLTYTGASRVTPNEEWALEIAVLDGSARVTGAGTVTALRPADTNVLALSAAQPTEPRARRLESPELLETVVWAAAAGRKLGGRLDNVRPSAETLPGGSVILSDALVLNGEMGQRIFRLDGPEFDFPLPGGRKGRVVQLLNNGALFEVQGEVVREFVPFGQSRQ